MRYPHVGDEIRASCGFSKLRLQHESVSHPALTLVSPAPSSLCVMVFKKKFAGMLVALAITAFALPGVAAAQQIEPTQSQYDDTATQVATGVDQEPGAGGPSADGLDSRVGPLPFTGFDVIAMAAVALAVTGLGLALQRAVSREPSDQLK
jgi:hypothetical protein